MSKERLVQTHPSGRRSPRTLIVIWGTHLQLPRKATSPSNTDKHRARQNRGNPHRRNVLQRRVSRNIFVVILEINDIFINKLGNRNTTGTLLPYRCCPNTPTKRTPLITARERTTSDRNIIVLRLQPLTLTRDGG